MYFVKIFLVTFILGRVDCLTSSELIQEFAGMTTPEYVSYFEYPIETHKVVTTDGYILTLHRIPHPKRVNQVHATNPPVLLMHGLICSSFDWVLNGPTKALAFILSELGLDVWMGNFRGNQYSRAHVSLNPDKREFWNFSFHELGIYDLPRMIDYILSTTGKSKLFHIGHSLGTTTFYVMASKLPQYNSKILLHFSLAPVAFMKHAESPIFSVAPLLTGYSDIFNNGEFLPNSDFLDELAITVCPEPTPTDGVCENIVFLISGFDPDQLNNTMLPVILSHIPAGASSRTVVHYNQLHQVDYFREFDTRFLYIGLPPKNYNLSRVTAPVHLLAGLNDWLASITDVNTLSQSLPNVKSYYKIPYNKWNHLDFLYGIDAPKYVYDYVVKFILSIIN